MLEKKMIRNYPSHKRSHQSTAPNPENEIAVFQAVDEEPVS
jgi:hypothetical protein